MTIMSEIQLTIWEENSLKDILSYYVYSICNISEEKIV